MGVRIQKWMVEKYGPTEGCRGCGWVLGKHPCYMAHDDNCRKHFIEMSNEPDNEDLKERVVKDFVRMIRKLLETEEANTQVSKKARTGPSR